MKDFKKFLKKEGYWKSFLSHLKKGHTFKSLEELENNSIKEEYIVNAFLWKKEEVPHWVRVSDEWRNFLKNKMKKI